MTNLITIMRVRRYFVAVATVSLVAIAIAAAKAQPVGALACPTDPGQFYGGGGAYLAPRGGGRTHAGIDIGVSFRPIYAAESGSVIHNEWYSGYGNTVDLRGSSSGNVYRYAHLNFGNSGDYSAGQQIGQTGNSEATSDHLHWEIRTDGGGFSGQDGSNGTIDPTASYQECGAGNPQPSDCHTVVLRQGAAGDCVRHLQEHLNERSYGLIVDGQFGPATEAAVKDFESKVNQEPDGIVGPDTWQALHSAGPAQPAPAAPSNYKNSFLNTNSNRCLDVPANSTDNGTQVQLWDCNGSPAQQWTIDSQGSIRANNGKCLDLNQNDATNGSRVQVWDCNGSDAQRWTYSNQNLRAAVGKCLDVPSSSVAAGTKLQIWECNGSGAQKWNYNGSTSTPSTGNAPANPPVAPPPSSSPPAGSTTTPSNDAPTLSANCPGGANGVSHISLSWRGVAGIQSYVLDIDDDNWAGGWWNKNTGTATSTTAPDGFKFYPNDGGPLTLTPGRTYYARVFYAGPNLHSATLVFNAPNCQPVSTQPSNITSPKPAASGTTPATIEAPSVNTLCIRRSAKAIISWTGAELGSQGYYIDLSERADFTSINNKYASPSSNTTIAPDGFNGYAGSANIKLLQSTQRYYIRIFYPAAAKHSPTASFVPPVC